ncbi:MAG: heavy metal translocating P-type ATPase [Campylobacter sp.]|nr:heavy metal translocating P-type ATPase [Campylobacter sp.]
MSQKIKYNIVGMTCVNCSNAIERITSKIKGVKSANVSFASSYGEFEVDDPALAKTIESKIQKLGYEIATDYEELSRKKARALNSMKNRLILAVCLTLVIVYLSMFAPSSGPVAKDSFVNHALQFVLAGVVVFYCAKSYFTHGIGALKSKNFDMNVLVMLGTSCAFLYSSIVFLFGEFVSDEFSHVYFESAGMIISFVLFGKYLEERSKNRANDYIKTLLNLTPKTALLLKPDGTTEEISADSLKIGDVVMVKSGMSIPCDGEIIHGGAEIDASVLTGESLPVYKSVGEIVNAGCTNANGVLSIKVTTPKHETLLMRITKLLSEAAAKKMPVSRFADKVANIFVPSVIGIALLTFIVWTILGNPYNGIMCAISVLVISCPCALGLATPISIVCGISNLAKNGVLVKNPEVLEILKDTQNVVFDKTGTLTKGEISVYDTNLDDESLKKVASVELLSEHLISKAVVRYAKNRDLKFEKSESEFENIVGMGIKVGEILVGNEALLAKNGIKIAKSGEFDKFLQDGFGVILVAIDGVYKGFIALSDTPRKSTKDTISWLKSKDINTVMLTGDNAKVAKFIASKLGIDEVYSDVLPQSKFEVIKKYKESGKKTIFVGDGVNDALPLKGADCGVAMNSGSDIAKGAGDALLVNNDLSGIKKLIFMSQRTMRTIKQNLFWAFFYNVICIPIATGVFVSFGLLLQPHFAALAMSFSSVTVVLNSLRLKLLKLD